MSEKIHCKQCKFGEFVQQFIERSPGACKKNPPVPVLLITQTTLGQQQAAIQPVFPPVFESDWCGSAEPKNSAIVQ